MYAQNAGLIAKSRQDPSRLHYLKLLYTKGCALLGSGRHEEAVAAFKAALAIAPDFDDAAQNLGCCLAALGRYTEAAGCYADVARRRPDEAVSQFNFGCTLLASGDHERAVAPLLAAVRLGPGVAKYFHVLGQALIAAGRKAEALPLMIEAVRLEGSDPVAQANLAGLLVEEGRLEEAVAAGISAVRIGPENPFAQANLARALHGLGRSEQALAPALEAVGLAPEDGGAAATLGAVHYMLGHYTEALSQSRRAGRLAPELYQAKANEAVALEALGRLDEAAAAGLDAIALAPTENAEVRHNLACIMLRSGRMNAEVWSWYDARLKLTSAARELAAIPSWAGQDVAGRTVLLYSEQGFGDTIQFARYAPLVEALGARVILAVQPALLRLMRDLPGMAAVVPAEGPHPDHDIFCPLLSLPRVFKTTLETIPPPLSILPDPALVERWLVSTSRGLQVGLVWSGSPTFSHDRARSIGVDEFETLAGMPGVTLHSLQLSAGRRDVCRIVDRMQGVSDFADTAAIIAGLDLLIAVDSSVAHLAASMGKDVWLLSRFVGCWRWLRDREDSPWYPTMHIYRQPRPGDWGSVIARVRTDLLLKAGISGRSYEPAP